MSKVLRSKALNNISAAKVDQAREEILKGSGDLLSKNTKNDMVMRFVESNIPLAYWNLKMEKDFFGDANLKKEFDAYTEDLKKTFVEGRCLCLAGQHGTGKQLCLETELPTPNGFIKLKDLKEGQQLFDESGNFCNVIKLHPIQTSPQSYRIYFDDGSTVDACEDHLWQTFTRNERRDRVGPGIRTTKQIIETIAISPTQKHSNHSILCCDPIQYSEKNLPIDPYVLGCWLGDGNSDDGGIECADEQILQEIRNAGFSVNLKKSSIDKSKSRNYRIGNLIRINKTGNKIGELTFQLRQLNLIKNKHIPEIYLFGSYAQRLSLLQGLLDTDGCCLKTGLIEYCTIIPELANQVAQLVKSFGIKCKVKKNKTFLYGKRCNDRYRITFTTTLPFFRLQRKLKNIRLEKTQKSRTTHRFIVKIKKIKSKPMRCITVNSPSHLFLVTRNFIATHNTMVSSCILKKAALKGFSALYTTLSDVVAVLTQGSMEDKFEARRELILVDFLVLDEVDPRFVGSDNASDLFGRNLEGIFRTRSQNKLPTIICTNSPNLVESFTGSLKQSLGSLFAGGMKTVVVMGKDFRKHGETNPLREEMQKRWDEAVGRNK